MESANYLGVEEVPLIEITEGEVVDYRAIRRRIDWASKLFKIVEIDYDKRYATETINELVDSGYMCVEIRQGFPGMGDPTKRFLELVTEGKVRHGGNPILRWNADCMSVKRNNEGEIMPVKPERARSGKRIDGIVAAIMATGRALVARPAAEPTMRWL